VVEQQESALTSTLGAWWIPADPLPANEDATRCGENGIQW